MKHVQRHWWIAQKSWGSRSTLTCGRAMAVVAAVGAVVLASASAWAQGAIGESNARKPFVMIMMDSSSSMEWTDEGDEEYPNNGDADEWESGKPLSDVERYGPCFVWEVDNCSDYDRPAWNTDETWSANSGDAKISARRAKMTDNQVRLKNASQPRHVTLKEILTGDMVMYGATANGPLKDLNPNTHGPGCWLVPRQYGTSSGSPDICTDNSGDLGRIKKYPDYDDALPHFQEVFDGQLRNGLMDTISGNAIFGVAMFDGYKQSTDEPVKGWNAGDAKDLDDSMKQDKKFGGLTEGKGDASENKPDKANYNLGVFQMLAPEKMEMSTTVASEISSFVQYALIDAGYLSENDRQLRTRGDQNTGLATNRANTDLGVEFSADLSDYFDKDYELGRQPIARATPLAAAMYDIHEFFALGRRGKKYGKKNGKKHSNKSPVVTDAYKQCRPKHVIMITDGEPEPEREPKNDDQVVNLGLNTLSSAFQYDRAQYPYPPTERAIEYFMNDETYPSLNADGSLGANSANPGGTSGGTQRETPGSDASYLVGSWTKGSADYDDAVRYNPRVHVVGLTGQVDQNPGGPDNLEEKVVQKLANMAKEGRTCAGYYLGEEWIPEGDSDSDPSGTCKPSETYCLDQRQAKFIDSLDDDPDDDIEPYKYVDHQGDETACRYPALVLSTTNEDADLVKRTAQAMQLLFNNIVGTGLTARTRPTYVNHVDDPKHQIGGQYRFYSGLSTDVGETFRRGLLYRRAKTCSNDADTGKSSLNAAGSVDIAEQIARLAPESGDDRRRIFTSFVSDDAFNYETRNPKRLASGDGISDRLRFLFGMNLEEAENDEFGPTTMQLTPDRLVGTRVRFEKKELQSVLDGLNTSNGDLSEDLTLMDYFSVPPAITVEDFIDEVRGRSDLKKFDPDTGTGRAFGAIRNATPVAVEPPNLDLPIDSYRAFKGQYADRPSMLFSATTDGMLHAIYSGQLDGSTDKLVRKREDGDDVGNTTMEEQREAWAYIPQMLHKGLGGNTGGPPYLLDGTPTVKDVRLCHQTNSYNFNRQACRCDSSSPDGSCMTRVDQWRSVLVEGLGRAGAGYFALDVTRPGGDVTAQQTTVPMPDPIPLWEFDANWERGQVTKLGKNHPDLVYPKSDDLFDGNFIDECDTEQNNDTNGDDVRNFYWDQPFLGLSVGQAAIGTIALQAKFDDGDRLRRPIAVFSGGLNIEDRGCDSDRIGRAIYVVDLQTGSLLRRFVTYIADSDGEEEAGEHRFEHPISGSPALYDARPGSLATRGFVGGGDGKLFRIDMSSDDPEEWQVDLFFDPSEDLDDDSGSGGGPGNASVDFGPAAFKPALALSTADLNHDLLVFYGLGERGDLSTSGSTQMMIAVQEKINTSGDEYEVSAVGDPLWHAPFQDGSGDYKEKLTSEPVVFNKGVYFTSFVEPSEDSCEPGWSRIYGMKFEGGIDSNGEHVPEGLFEEQAADLDGRTETLIPDDTEGYRYEGTGPFWAYQPENTNQLSDPVVVRGVSVTLGASCLSNPTEASGVQVQQQERTPTLMAQSSSDKLSDSDDDPVGSAGTDDLHAIEQSLAKPDTQIIPLSWGVVDN